MDTGVGVSAGGDMDVSAGVGVNATGRVTVGVGGWAGRRVGVRVGVGVEVGSTLTLSGVGVAWPHPINTWARIKTVIHVIIRIFVDFMTLPPFCTSLSD